jgi:hypothetical protein
MSEISEKALLIRIGRLEASVQIQAEDLARLRAENQRLMRALAIIALSPKPQGDLKEKAVDALGVRRTSQLWAIVHSESEVDGE